MSVPLTYSFFRIHEFTGLHGGQPEEHLQEILYF